MRILLGSGGFRTEERVANLRRRLIAHLGPIAQVLFIPYALHDHDKYLQTMTERGLNAGYELVGIHRCTNPRDAVANADAIYVGGGNTFRLLNSLYQYDLLDAIRARVRAGVPYIGVSAGSNVACPTMQTTNDMPIVQPPALPPWAWCRSRSARIITWAPTGSSKVRHSSSTSARRATIGCANSTR
jgi:dipeptidase E